ncbi:MAG: 1-acyl-sn-glycerol-3-phosphate acyltransferase [Spirochaetales bacterium]|nr:1-acyl-sn-glycerol-3-phosphate acyltransferase [Spirochaetales bacterium]
MKNPFIPPHFNLPLAWSIDLLHSGLLKMLYNITSIEISAEDRALLRSLRYDRLILIANHPSSAEPPVTYHLANVMGARFHYMAAREVFEWGYGVVGKVIANLGAFSVIAGSTDRESLKTAREILAAPSGKLVLYPEGEPTSGENDNLLPFQGGVVQLGFWAMDDLRKQEPEGDITILPVFIKYRIEGTDAHIKSILYSRIKSLENRFRIDPGNKNLLRRFLSIGRILLESTEKEYNIPIASRSDWDYRMGRVRHAILDGVAEKLAFPGYERKGDAITKLRQILSILECVKLRMPVRDMPAVDSRTMKFAERECQKAYAFIAIKRDYLVSYPTPERFFEWLRRFENFVYGEFQEPERKAFVYLGLPFKISEYYTTNRLKKKINSKGCLGRMQKEIQALMDKARLVSEPIVRPFDIGE